MKEVSATIRLDLIHMDVDVVTIAVIVMQKI
jgi:hypothetical protein